jgi:hypothetical protein
VIGKICFIGWSLGKNTEKNLAVFFTNILISLRNREAWRHIVEEAKAHPGL